MFGIAINVAAVSPNTATIAKIANVVLFILRNAEYILYKDLWGIGLVTALSANFDVAYYLQPNMRKFFIYGIPYLAHAIQFHSHSKFHLTAI